MRHGASLCVARFLDLQPSHSHLYATCGHHGDDRNDDSARNMKIAKRSQFPQKCWASRGRARGMA
jgi:hypothetical protein